MGAVLRTAHLLLTTLLLQTAISTHDPFQPWMRSANTDILELLLGGDADTASHFLSNAFGVQSYLLRDSTREDRATWVRMRRRWLPREDLDGVLAHNASAFERDAPLALGFDVELERPEPNTTSTPRVQRIRAHCARCGSAFNLRAAHAAFREGFALRIRRLDRRVTAVAAATQHLRAACHTSVSATLVFAPPSRAAQTVAAPAVLAQAHHFWIQLDGSQTVRTLARDDDGDAEIAHELAEGDVLYLPPLAQVARYGERGQVSLHVEFTLIGTPTRADALMIAIDTCTHTELDEVLPGARGTPTWRDLLQAAASTAARVVSALQLPLPVAPLVEALVRDATGASAVETLVAETARFAMAAERSALLRPILDELAGSHGDLADWASALLRTRVAGRSSMEQVTTMFHSCLRALTASPDLAPRAMRALRERIARNAANERAMLVHEEMDALRRHGQEFEVDISETRSLRIKQGETMCLRRIFMHSSNK